MRGINNKTGMAHGVSREFIRNHFEEFVNRKNVNIGNVIRIEFRGSWHGCACGNAPGSGGRDCLRGRCLETVSGFACDD